tara:strand:- start:23342 stop:23446 length:105 start_codon:yes stop_codon:yes gene_type:complete
MMSWEKQVIQGTVDTAFGIMISRSPFDPGMLVER